MGLAEFIGFIVLVVAVVVIGVIAARRAWLTRTGAFDVSWRRKPSANDRGWSLGQARYRGSRLGMYRSFSLLPMAAVALDRSQLELGSVREHRGAESDLLPFDAIIVQCADDRGPLELALSDSALTGLRSWVESRPPGHMPAHGDSADDGLAR